MKRRSDGKERIPPFVSIAGRIFVVTNWNEDREDVGDGDALLLRQLGRKEESLYRSLLRDALVEAFARTEAKQK